MKNYKHLDFVVNAIEDTMRHNGVHGYAASFLILSAALNRLFEEKLLPNKDHIPKELISATRLFLTGSEYDQ